MKHELDKGLNSAIEAAGNAAELARRLDVSRSAISQWERVPLERVLEVERVTGVPRYILRPDFFIAQPALQELDRRKGG